MSEPRIGVLALQGGVAEHTRHLEALGAPVIAVRTPADLDASAGVVIPGGESTTIDKLLGITGLFEPLAERIADGMPVYGSCAGMVLLASEIVDTRQDARSFGAIDMVVRRNAFGRQVDSFERDVVIDEFGAEPMRTVFIRAPWVEKTGDVAEVLATVTDPGGNEHAVAVRQGWALATSFHPEMTDDLRVHRYFIDMVAEAAS